MIIAAISLGLLGYINLLRPSNIMVKVFGLLASSMILIQVLLTRWNVVIGGQLMSKSGRGSVLYQPGWMEKEGILLAIVVIVFPVILLYYLEKIFPVWQDEEQPPIRGSVS